MKITWKGTGKKKDLIEEVAIIECDKSYLRPLDVNYFDWGCKKSQKKT